jgi:rod shape-determining protein MreD
MNGSLNVGLVWRVAVLALVTVIVQVAAIGQFPVLGDSVDLTPLLVVAVALLAGPVAGAVTGFGMGLLIDLLLLQTMGVSSLVLLATGYGVGRIREMRDIDSPLVPLAAGGIGTAAALVGYALLQFLLGINAPVSFLLVREILVTILVNTLLSLPVFLIVRRVLASTLPDYQRRRRRKSSAPLSPLQQP